MGHLANSIRVACCKFALKCYAFSTVDSVLAKEYSNDAPDSIPAPMALKNTSYARHTFAGAFQGTVYRACVSFEDKCLLRVCGHTAVLGMVVTIRTKWSRSNMPADPKLRGYVEDHRRCHRVLVPDPGKAPHRTSYRLDPPRAPRAGRPPGRGATQDTCAGSLLPIILNVRAFIYGRCGGPISGVLTGLAIP